MKRVAFSVRITICAAFALFVAALPAARASEPSAAAVTVAKPDAAAALKILKAGNERFAAGKAEHPHSQPDRVALAGTSNQADYAYATIISCSDSRVPVERLFDSGVMDLFIIRVAGNVVDGDEAGSIEYGLAHVRTPLLVVLGHSQCGAVKAVTDAVEGHGHELERNIPALVDNIAPAVKRAKAAHPDLHGKDLVPYGVEENVWQGVEDLFMRSPDVRAMVLDGRVRVVGAVYDVGSGRVNWLPEEKVKTILGAVEKNPQRVQGALAGKKEGAH